MNYQIILLKVTLCTGLICACLMYHKTDFARIFFFKINNETKTGTEGNMKHFFKPMPDHYRKFLLKPVPDQHRNSLFSKISTGISLSPEFRSLTDKTKLQICSTSKKDRKILLDINSE